MKIIFLSHSLEIGGAEYIIKNFINTLQEKFEGIQPKLILINKKGFLLKKLNKEVSIINLKSSRTIYSFFKIIKILKKEKPEYIFSTLPHLNLFLLILDSIFNFKSKIIIRETTNISMRIFLSKTTKEKLINYFIPFFYNRAYKIISLSRSMTNDMISNYKIDKTKIVTLGNPIDFAEITKDHKKKLKINRKIIGPYFLTVGRLVKEKNFIFLIKSFYLFNNKKIKLVIVGDGPEKKLKKLIYNLNLQNKIILTGELSNPYPLIKKCSAYINCSLREGFPNSVIHALFFNRPTILTTDVPVNKEIIRLFKCYKFSNNYKSLVLAMKQSISKNHFTHLKNSNKDKVLKLYDNKKILEKILNKIQ